MALNQAVRQGKALYVGISNYPAEMAEEASRILKELGTPCLIHQPKYSMFERWVEGGGLLDVLEESGIGCIAFSPLAQGLLTNRYLKDIPSDSRAGKPHGFLKSSQITPEVLDRIRSLNTIAEGRSQSLAQMSIAWLLKDSRVTSVLIGASRVSQLEDNLKAIKNITFSKDELNQIEKILK
jgi:L-glyceraldehyde 3-phosphate reductase